MKYTKENLEKLAKESYSVRQICHKLGLQLSGSSNSHIRSRLTKFGIDTSHFLGKAINRGKVSGRKKPWSEHLIVNKNNARIGVSLVKRCLKEAGVKYECKVCSNPGQWMGKPLVLEVDHINGCGWDNRLENLQYLCPQCHSQKTLGM